MHRLSKPNSTARGQLRLPSYHPAVELLETRLLPSRSLWNPALDVPEWGPGATESGTLLSGGNTSLILSPAEQTGAGKGGAAKIVTVAGADGQPRSWLHSGPDARPSGNGTRSEPVIVNVVPYAFSAEKTYQSEPSIAVNPLNPDQMVIATFGPLPGQSSNNPIFSSADGGQSWDNFPFHNYSHGDITLDWSASGTAYAALLNSALNPRSSNDPTTNNPANQFITIPNGNYSGSVDQPWIRAVQVDGTDR